MENIEINAFAKINLTLDVLGKRDDGYHEVSMIMQTISLYDKVKLTIIEEGVKIECKHKWVPEDDRNIAYKAAKLFLEDLKINKGVSINIIKNIPVAAGLAGGSTNAAAVLNGMNILFKTNLTKEQLAQMGKKIGADVPFCIYGGTMLAEGIGEKLQKVKGAEKLNMVVVKPDIGVSTEWVYKSLELSKVYEHPNTNEMLKALEDNDLTKIAQNMKNVLETVTANRYTVINKIKQNLLEYGAVGSLMSGSGPSVFGVFENEEKAKSAYEKLREIYEDCFYVISCENI